ncbi:hypothetical protein A3B45_05280 [Candidatus Daviesbacteria bacterium RIFCSPLOWO2_01_FULL_39_12]|uniref:Uncharacterized protein n=1 Tax=Candidatus Daviesbacteria bacterium RIFCSPLOWO2_01_FULL_39_12 TaxID=1797785 RepID=A0A1F5KPZ7_9BACT|nr:MAG: hypothetical protein A3D79_02585 [Candidatus Daviesbacteria bacterium RIFCSPHIGHO2_02_FULL_39_8]OGE43017.1 MAG: hypothetical protein A3B45_05280 [Candidatus Daviesbacteria bacterium RIFCSPLOWO2_01_FULL_39_12]
MKFKSKKPHYQHLRRKWHLRHKAIQEKLWEKHADALRKFAVGSIGGLMLLSNPLHQTGASTLPTSQDEIYKEIDTNAILAKSLSDTIPNDIRPLQKDEEDKITDILSKSFGFKVTGEIDGIRLNRNYGLIGGEQHLYRYPGDTLYAHADNTTDWAMYGSSGIAPGLGAWGYFASSKDGFGEIDKLRERYYLAIQTFLVPGFAENVVKYRDFFKYRKMLVVNAQTGQSVVAVIGDAGPAEWTGKHLGGSPEVMHFLGLAEGPRKGSVLYFFIDDPEDKIPLGPVKAKVEI